MSDVLEGKRWLVRQGDALEVLKTLPGESFDACITGPPAFGTSLEGMAAATDREGYVLSMLHLARRVVYLLKPPWMFWLTQGSRDGVCPAIIRRQLLREGWILSTAWGTNKPATFSHDFVDLFERTEAPIHAVQSPAMRGGTTAPPYVLEGYPFFVIPYTLALSLVATTPEGCTILDPFAGSGQIGVAALTTGRRYYGIDIDAHAVRFADKRLQRTAEEYP